MKQKSRKPVRGVLQTWEMIEITDPGEIAALEQRIRAAEKVMAEREKAIATNEKTQNAKPRKRK